MFQGSLSYREISAITGLSETNVGFLIHAGLKRLRERLTKIWNAVLHHRFNWRRLRRRLVIAVIFTWGVPALTQKAGI